MEAINKHVEEIRTYNGLLDKVEALDDEDGESRFKSIDGHSGPLRKGDLEYKRSPWNVKVNWENADSTWAPLSIIAQCDPVPCAIYAEKNGLLSMPGWKQFQTLEKKQTKLLRMVHQTKLKSYSA